MDGSYIMLITAGGVYATNLNRQSLNSSFGLGGRTITSASCAMSYDGKYMRAISKESGGNSGIYTSLDYGFSMDGSKLPSAFGLPTSNLSLIALSGTGLYQLVSTTNTLYVSTNTGTSFALCLSIPSIIIISSIAVSQTGQYMIACCSSTSVKGYVYYSTNFGANWQIMTALGQDNFNSCAISEDGILFTVSTPSAVYTLNNSLIGNSVAIGNGAGQTNQAGNSVAIGNGAGQTNQPANTIAINASGTALNPSMSNGCYIAPIAGVSNSMSTFFNLLGYGSDNQIVKSNVFINSTGNSIINNYSPAKEDIGYFLKAGNASFYIGDDYSSLPTGSGLTYGRYFGTGGNIFQDFSGSFIWRRVTNASNALATSSTCMTLDNNGNLSMGGIITAHGIGIGTTSPGFTLDVYGNVRFTIGIRIDSGSVNCLGEGNGNGLLLNHVRGGTCEIYNGGVDTFNPTGNNNLMIRSWYGIGFQSYDNAVRVAIDTRAGNISASGNISLFNGNYTITRGSFTATNATSYAIDFSSGYFKFFATTVGISSGNNAEWYLDGIIFRYNTNANSWTQTFGANAMSITGTTWGCNLNIAHSISGSTIIYFLTRLY
jgi:hypothetical protein